MLDPKTLLGAASIIALAAALPATDPNDDDFACFSSYREHDSSSWAFEEQYTTELVSTREWVDEATDTNVPLTTLCDGRPRALEPYKTSLVTSTETLDPPEITTRYSRLIRLVLEIVVPPAPELWVGPGVHLVKFLLGWSDFDAGFDAIGG